MTLALTGVIAMGIGCAAELHTWADALRDGDELSQHRAVRSAVACERSDPAAFAVAAAAVDVAGVVAGSPVAREHLQRSLDQLGPTLGAALLEAVPVEPLAAVVAAQRWVVESGRIAGDGPYAAAAARAVRAALTRAQGAPVSRRLLFEVETLTKLISGDTGAAMRPPPPSAAQREIRRMNLVTSTTLRDRLAAEAWQ